MKRVSYSLLAIGILLMVSCKEGADNAKVETATETIESSKPADTQPANQPKSYKVVFSPDSAILGKKSEALVKAMGGNAVAMQDPEGKDNGIELTLKLQATNLQAIGENNFSISYGDSRLQLDNGTNITAESGSDFLRAKPESSSPIETWTFKIPAGAKPTALNLYMDGTRVSMGVKLD